MELIREILDDAEEGWKAQQPKSRRGTTPRDPGNMTLLHVLQAYESVLRKRGISPDDDTYFYRFLLSAVVPVRQVRVALSPCRQIDIE